MLSSCFFSCLHVSFVLESMKLFNLRYVSDELSDEIMSYIVYRELHNILYGVENETSELHLSLFLIINKLLFYLISEIYLKGRLVKLHTYSVSTYGCVEHYIHLYFDFVDKNVKVEFYQKRVNIESVSMKVLNFCFYYVRLFIR